MEMLVFYRLEYLLPEEWGNRHIKLPIYLDKAIELGLADLDENTFRHPHNGEVSKPLHLYKIGYVYCSGTCMYFRPR